MFSVRGTIRLGRALPAIHRRVKIDATTAPGYHGGGPPVVAINCHRHLGLVFGPGAGGSALLGVAVDRAGDAGVTLVARDITLNHDYIGLNLQGHPAGNHGNGVLVASDGHRIGLNPARAVNVVSNVISANAGAGIVLAGSAHNTVVSNRIGTNRAGTRALGNRGDGRPDLTGAARRGQRDRAARPRYRVCRPPARSPPTSAWPTTRPGTRATVTPVFEGWLTAEHGSGTAVADLAATSGNGRSPVPPVINAAGPVARQPAEQATSSGPPATRYDLQPGSPDLSLFPRSKPGWRRPGGRSAPRRPARWATPTTRWTPGAALRAGKATWPGPAATRRPGPRVRDLRKPFVY